MISPLAYVDPSAQIGKNVTIHPFAYIDKNVVIGDNCVVMPYASIMSGARLGSGNVIYQGAVIGTPPQDFKHKGEDTIVRIGDNNVIRENAVIIRASAPEHETVIGDGNFIMQAVRISHDATIGNHCIIGNGSYVAGRSTVGNYSILASSVIMTGHIRVGDWSVIQGGCRFSNDVPPYVVVAHEPAAFYSINTKVLQHNGFSETIIKHIAHAYRIIYHANTSVDDAIYRVEQQVPRGEEINNIIKFITESKVGIIK